MIFRVNRPWAAALDVRGAASFAEPAIDGPQHGVVRCVVGCRRSGKTWALRAIEHAARQENVPVQFLDLREARLPHRVPKGTLLLLDEPGRYVRDDVEGPAFLEECGELRREHDSRILIAASPGEWAHLRTYSRSAAGVDERDVAFLSPLTSAQAARLARTPDATTLLAQLPPQWTRQPFLLELLFQIAEEDQNWSAAHVVARIHDRVQDVEFRYLEAVHDRGLTDSQCRFVSAIGWGEEPQCDADCDVLVRCGLVQRTGGKFVIADPVVTAAFPPPLRIHHVSDVHCGPKTARTTDVKVNAALGEVLAAAVGAQDVRDDYLDHLRQGAGDVPHVVVVSGDLTEWCKPDELQAAIAWLDEVEAALPASTLLADTDARVLVVGGNHDVQWDLAAPEQPPHARHAAFAMAVARTGAATRRARPLPQLDMPADQRQATRICYARAEVELLLLGSAELGGEQDPAVQQLLQQVEQQRRAEAVHAASASSPAARQPIAGGATAPKPPRIDPGTVHPAAFPKTADWTMPTRIAVLHHPVSPLPATEVAPFSGLINAGELKDRLLAAGFCLVLHGHAHTGWFGVEQWPGRHGDRVLRIASAPSLGSREVQEQHGFNEIVVRRGRRAGKPIHEIIVRRFVREGRSWRADATMGPFVPGER